MQILSPIGVRPKIEHRLARRPASLEGRVLRFLDNHKFSVDEFFGHIEPRLKLEFGVSEVIYRRKPSTSEPAPFLDDLAKQCEVVVNAIAD
jgi:hypothetical protein